MEYTLADIKPEDVISHVVNSLANADANVWTDEAGFTWVTRGTAGYSALAVEITDPEGITTTFRLTAVED